MEMEARLHFDLEPLPDQEGVSERDKPWQIENIWLEFASRGMVKTARMLLDSVK